MFSHGSEISTKKESTVPPMRTKTATRYLNPRVTQSEIFSPRKLLKLMKPSVSLHEILHPRNLPTLRYNY